MAVFLCLLLIATASYALRLLFRNQHLTETARTAEAHAATLQQRLTVAMAGLEKYRPVIDAESHATQLLRDAQGHAERLRNEAQQSAASLLATSTQYHRDAEQRVAEGTQQASAIIANADQRAQAIAGDALRARDSAQQVAATLQAMRNAVEGYGDLYLVPTDGLLDELANEVGFSEVGLRLKAARDHVRGMIKARTAAACDDIHPNRRLLAIHFVLDAFNGKVDAILADVRHDNYGTLEQKLRDAALLVNKNGQAFENARVLPQYVEARVAELKWAVAVHELKRRDREEQRALKERIREEERAQKEFERAIKEAAEEEDKLRAAMEKVQREVTRATSEQRSKYEQQLAELNAKLVAAEEKNKRALSMAQQTKSGTVYVISNVGSFGENVFKIGMTRRLEPQDRVDELGDASVPFPFDVHAFITAEDAPALERELHRRFVSAQVNKVNPRKEFFRTSLVEIKDAVAAVGCSKAIWTMAAECLEYRESVACEHMGDRPAGASSQVADNLSQANALLTRSTLELAS